MGLISAFLILFLCGCANKKVLTSYNQNEITFTIGDVSFTMIKVDGGSFQMGNNNNDADSKKTPVHNVTLDSYYIGETEVTQGLWVAVMGREPYCYGGWKKKYGAPHLDYISHARGKGNYYPAYYINWYDCQKFIKRLNQLTGKNFRLPTEAEWEYAARGGKKSRGYKYSGSNIADEVAWYSDNNNDYLHPVKGRFPNELGIYDMSGNVWEWCEDLYEEKSAGNSDSSKSSNLERVLRGGGWRGGSYSVSHRYGANPKTYADDAGFRIVLVP